MIGVVIAQLFRLQHTAAPSPVFGYFILAKPLAALFQIVAMLLSVVGAHRFWRQQMNMARGKIVAGGWEVYLVMITVLLVSQYLDTKIHDLTADDQYH